MMNFENRTKAPARERRRAPGRMARLAAGVSLAALASAWASAAFAQSATDAAPVLNRAAQQTVVEQSETTSDTYSSGDYSARTEPRVVAAGSDGASSPTEALRPLSLLRTEEGERVVRLQGEEDEIVASLYLPDAIGSQELQLRLRNSINSLPEKSNLIASVNGVALTPEALSFNDDFEDLVLDAPSLQAGENVIRLQVRQNHRIYCGVEASYSLWTEFDLAQSGAVWPAAAMNDPKTAFRAALQAQLADGRPIDLRAGDGAPDELIRRIAVAIAAQAKLGAAPAVRRISLWAPSDEASLSRVSVVESDVASVEIVRGGDGALVLLVAMPFDGSADVDAVFEQVAQQLPEAQPPRVAAALEPGRAMSFQELGFGPSSHQAHVFGREISFDLPEDWLVLDERATELTLQTLERPAAYAGAVVSVIVNGEPGGSFRIDGEDQEVVRERLVKFETNRLRPGRNVVQLVGELPLEAENQPCPILDDPIVEIASQSTILVPDSPRMRTPGLAAALKGLSGDRIERASGAIAAPLSDVEMAAFAGIGPSFAPSETSLTVLNVADLAALEIGDVGVTRTLLRRSLSPVVETTRTSEIDDEASFLGGYIDVEATIDAVSAVAHEAWDMAAPGDGSLDDWLRHTRADAILLQPTLSQPDKLWLVVADGADVSTVAAAIRRARGAADGPYGQISALADNGAWTSWRSPYAYPWLLEPMRGDNVVAVTSAYASWAPGLFASAGIGAAWICAYIWAIFLRAGRARRSS